jgi:hypothetical protein
MENLKTEISMIKDRGKALIVYQKYAYLLGITIVIALAVILIVPSRVFQNAIDNAFAFVNGLTTSTSIVVGFSGAINGLVFKELTKNNPEFKRKFFEGFGLFLIPLMEAFIAYVLLATSVPDFAIKFSLCSFLTAFLTIVLFYLLIAEKIEVAHQQPQTSQPTQSPIASEPQSKTLEDADSKDGDKTVNITINM